MAALTDVRDTRELLNGGKMLSLEVAADAVIFAGGIVCLDADGFAVPASTATALRAIGRAEETADNTSGADGHLLQSIQYFVESDRVIVGSNLKYAAIHQFGGLPNMRGGAKFIPARPYIGLSADNIAELEEILEQVFPWVE